MRRLFTLLKVTTYKEFLLISVNHFFTGKLAQSNPVLHRLLVFTVACADNHINVSKHSRELLLLNWKEGNTSMQFYVRKYTRDLLVFTQFFIDKDWVQYIKPLQTKFNEEFKFIIDAGANIGCSAFFLHILFPNAKIVCIEPEVSNYQLLNKNIQINKASFVIFALQRAVWNELTELELMQRDWSHDGFHVMKKPMPDEVISKIATITFPQLLQDFGYNQIDFLKIDIEGAEKIIFEDELHVKLFLPKTKHLVMEVHNEFINKHTMYQLLENSHFECEEIFITGQPTVIIANKK